MAGGVPEQCQENGDDRRRRLVPGRRPSRAQVLRFVLGLSPAEKLQLVEDPWDDLASNPDAVPVLDWQIAELARRKANPGAFLT